jgi:hypothetical protein
MKRTEEVYDDNDIHETRYDERIMDIPVYIEIPNDKYNIL